MKLKMFLVFLMSLLIFGGTVECKLSDQVSDMFKNGVSEEDMAKVLSKAEDVHAKIKVSLTTYFIENPDKISAEQVAKIKAANDAFEIAYKTAKKDIIDIKAVKAGQNVTFSDIKSELIIFWGKYEEFKKAIQPFVTGRVTFPDDVIKADASAIPTPTVDDIAKE